MRTWLVTALLLAVLASPLFTQPEVLEDVEENLNYSTPLQTTVSPSTGWTSGGEEIIITGSGFLDLRDTNVTYDGINHQWSKSTANYGDKSGQENAMAVDSNGHIHIVRQQVTITTSFTAFMMELHGLSPVSRAVRVLTVGILTWSSMTTIIFMRPTQLVTLHHLHTL